MAGAEHRPGATAARVTRNVLLLAALGVAFLVLRSPGDAQDDDTGGAPAAAAITVSHAPAAVHQIEDTEPSIATVRARRTPRVAAEVEGTVVEVVVEEGDAVRRNDLLAVLDDTNHMIDYRRSEAEVRRTGILVSQKETEAERQRRLVDDGHMPQLLVDEVEAELAALREEVEVAKSDFERAERNLARTRVLAPYEAVIAERHVSEGDYVNPGSTMFDLTANGTLQARIPVPESVADRLAKGLEVRLWRGDRDRGVITGTVDRVAPRVDDDSRSVTAIVEISDAPGNWRSGTSIDAEVVLETRSSILLPPESVVRRPSGTVVYVLGEDGIARERIVETGLRTSGWVEIVEGLAPGQDVIMDGAGFLTDGILVEATLREWAPDIAVAAPPDGAASDTDTETGRDETSGEAPDEAMGN